jgi:hypothetical protein
MKGPGKAALKGSLRTAHATDWPGVMMIVDVGTLWGDFYEINHWPLSILFYCAAAVRLWNGGG